jgi:hypothetical protein
MSDHEWSDEQLARIQARVAEIQRQKKAEPTPRIITFASEDLRPGDFIVQLWGHADGLVVFQCHCRSPRTAATALLGIFQQLLNGECFNADPDHYTVRTLPGRVIHQSTVWKAVGQAQAWQIATRFDTPAVKRWLETLARELVEQRDYVHLMLATSPFSYRSPGTEGPMTP